MIVIFGRLERKNSLGGEEEDFFSVALSKIRKKILNFINGIMHGS